MCVCVCVCVRLCVFFVFCFVKLDLFKEKIVKIPFTEYESDFKGDPHSEQDVLAYLKDIIKAYFNHSNKSPVSSKMTSHTKQNTDCKKQRPNITKTTATVNPKPSNNSNANRRQIESISMSTPPNFTPSSSSPRKKRALYFYETSATGIVKCKLYFSKICEKKRKKQFFFWTNNKKNNPIFIFCSHF